MWVACGVSITFTTSSLTREGKTPNNRRPLPNSTGTRQSRTTAPRTETMLRPRLIRRPPPPPPRQSRSLNGGSMPINAIPHCRLCLTSLPSGSRYPHARIHTRRWRLDIVPSHDPAAVHVLDCVGFGVRGRRCSFEQPTGGAVVRLCVPCFTRLDDRVTWCIKRQRRDRKGGIDVFHRLS